jgi:hypothetical protein
MLNRFQRFPEQGCSRNTVPVSAEGKTAPASVMNPDKEFAKYV